MSEDTAIAGAGRRAVTAFFDERAAAQKAVDDLVATGIAQHRIRLVEGGAEPIATEPVPTRDKGIWATVKDLFMADEDRHAYGEGLRRGGFLLSVETGAGDHDRIVSLLDREGVVDMDERQATWELEGWDPARAAADLRDPGTLEATPAPAGTPEGSGFATAAPAAIRDAGAPSRLRSYVGPLGDAKP